MTRTAHPPLRLAALLRAAPLALSILFAACGGDSTDSADPGADPATPGGFPTAAVGPGPASAGAPVEVSDDIPGDAPLWFTDEAAERGITAINHCGALPEDKVYSIEEIGSGAALFDMDGDGDLDAYVVDGCTIVPPGTEVDAPPERLPPATPEDWRPKFDGDSKLYENDGRGYFTDVTERAGLRYRGMGSGATAADFDNDGDLDLYLTAWGPNRLFRNDGKGCFTDVTEAAGVGDPLWSVGGAWLDYDQDGFLDLFVSNYYALSTVRDPEIWNKVDCPHLDIYVACGPKGMVGEPDSLFHNRGDGTFENVSETSGIREVEPRYGLGVVAFDYEGDGDTDIYVANDSRGNYLFENLGDRFKEVADLAGVALNYKGIAQAGMGIACGDFDKDGDLDLHLTNFSHDNNTVYKNEDEGWFSDVTMRSGFGQDTYFSLGWGTGFVDFDCDGDLDLFTSNGHVYPEADLRKPELSYRQRNRVHEHVDGKLRDVTGQVGPGLQREESSRGAAFGDVDGDGDIDILVINLNAAPTLLINHRLPGHGNHLFVRVEGTRCNKSALGTRVTVISGEERTLQEVRAGHSFASMNDLKLHFGLGAAERVDLEVLWPGGELQAFEDLAVGRCYVLREGEAELRVEQ